MIGQIRVLTVFGTRPEAIKMAPVARALAIDPFFNSKICVTGQHRQMLDQVLNIFDIVPDYDLNLMAPNQTLNGLASKIISTIDNVLEIEKPDLILVHGDTTTSMAAAIAGFHRNARVAHVEAGLRTHNMQQPWPEEFNRRLVDSCSDILFAPTEQARINLRSEGINENNICVTGNTVIDALHWIINKLSEDKALVSFADQSLPKLDNRLRTLLVTGHRRENFGDGLVDICSALAKLAERDDIQVVYPVHLNPNVQEPVQRLLSGKGNVHLIQPLDYISFVRMLQRCDIVLTDSGGIQEEAPSLGKPVLVMRDVTERPEAVKAGTVELVGTSSHRIIEKVGQLLSDQDEYMRFSRAHNPYGDGKAASRIADALKFRVIRDTPQKHA